MNSRTTFQSCTFNGFVRLTLCIVIGAFLVQTGLAQTPATQSKDPLVRARRLLSSGETQAAVKLLEAITAQKPAPPTAWMLLGNAQAKLGDVNAAAKTYQHAAGIPQLGPRPVRALFLLYAGAKRNDDAWTWYRRASGRVDFSGLAASSEIKNLRNDARFNAMITVIGHRHRFGKALALIIDPTRPNGVDMPLAHSGP